jgi:hypothetical protein
VVLIRENAKAARCSSGVLEQDSRHILGRLERGEMADFGKGDVADANPSSPEAIGRRSDPSSSRRLTAHNETLIS